MTLHSRYQYCTEPRPPSVGSASRARIIREISCQPEPSPSSSPARAFRSSSTVSICWKQLAKCKGVSWEQWFSWISAAGNGCLEIGYTAICWFIMVHHDFPHWNCMKLPRGGKLVNHGKPYLQAHPNRPNLHCNRCCTRCIGIKIMQVPEHGRSLRQFIPPRWLQVSIVPPFLHNKEAVFCCNMLQPSSQSLSALHPMKSALFAKRTSQTSLEEVAAIWSLIWICWWMIGIMNSFKSLGMSVMERHNHLASSNPSTKNNCEYGN